jgi:hypothetical protein
MFGCSQKADVICFLTHGHRLRSDEPVVTNPREPMVTNRQKLVNEEGEPLRWSKVIKRSDIKLLGLHHLLCIVARAFKLSKRVVVPLFLHSERVNLSSKDSRGEFFS